MVEKVIHNLNLVFPLLLPHILCLSVDNVDNFGDNSVYSVCKAWGNCGEIWIFMWKPEILWIFYPHFGRFCGFLWAFPCFFLLFLVLPFYCFYFTGIYSSRK